MTTLHSALKENDSKALRGIAVALGLIAYLGGLVYAGVRSYDLFARTLPAELLPLAIIGIVALELTALGLPLAIHYWTAPGIQRIAALGFYILDLALIAANAILDSAHNAGDLLPGFMAAYGTYIVPALPILVMVTWATLWALDPASRDRDMIAAVRAATKEAVRSQIIEEARAADITADVRQAARAMTREIVGETVGGLRRPGLPAPAAGMTSAGHGYNAEVPAWPAGMSADMAQPEPEAAHRPARNGTRKGAAPESPK